MVRRLSSAIIIAAGVVVLHAQAGNADKVLADMRTAIGGSDKIAQVKTLTAAGATRTPMGTSTLLSETTVAMAMPDKYVTRRMLTPVLNVTYRTSGFNGDSVINETEIPPTTDRVIVRTRGMVWPGPLTQAQRDALLREARHDFARTALVLFGSSLEAVPVQYSYAGQEDLAGQTAHVIQVTGADGFKARLFVDSVTNLPVMLTWEDLAPWAATSSTREGRQDDPGVIRQTEAFTAQWDQAEAALRVVEYRVQYSNFKVVEGLNLPHTQTRSIDGKAKDTTTFEQIRINSTIAESRFAVSKSKN